MWCCCEDDAHTNREGDAGQSERLEVSRVSLHRTQNEALLAGADVVEPVAVEWTHAETQEDKDDETKTRRHFLFLSNIKATENMRWSDILPSVTCTIFELSLSKTSWVKGILVSQDCFAVAAISNQAGSTS